MQAITVLIMMLANPIGSMLVIRLMYSTVINPNGTSPSECQHSLCWYTKRQSRIEVCQSTIDGHDLGCIYLLNQLAIYFSKC